jgi:hypothetical protein
MFIMHGTINIKVLLITSFAMKDRCHILILCSTHRVFRHLSLYKVVGLYTEKYVLPSLAFQTFASVLWRVVRNYKYRVNKDNKFLN